MLFIFSLISALQAESTAISENSELASYAQDLYRQKGINMPRSAFELQEQDAWGRVFIIRIVSRNTTLSDDLLQAFLVGGAITQHTRTAIDQVVVIADVEFSHRKAMVLSAGADCCGKLYNNRMDADVFTEKCLRLE